MNRAAGRRRVFAPVLRAATLVALGTVGQVTAGTLGLDQMPVEARPARIHPDYTSLVIPPNIAPLNFTIEEPALSYVVRLRGQAGTPILVQGARPAILLPEKEWQQLLAANAPGEILVEIALQRQDNQWQRFVAITNRVSREPVDPVFIYRKIHPTHNSWHDMGLYQRDLRSFKETPVLENRRFDHDCCHCHALRNNDPAQALILIRSTAHQNSLLCISNGTAQAVQGLAGISAWHPTVDIVACAFSKPRLLLHSAKNDMRDIAELESWLGYFRLGDEKVKKVPAGDDSLLQGFPAWAPDGKHLYFCSAPNPPTAPGANIHTCYSTVRYDLMRISYDAAQDKWGRTETVVHAASLGRSVAQPRISPDGRWLFFCGTQFGCWPTYDPTSDLYGIDLSGNLGVDGFSARKLELNSTECESWLSWSSNSRWVVFSSKRVSPLFNRPYLAYVSADGDCGKPFILPQADPAFYDSQLKTYTIPTLAKGPITIPEKDLVLAIKAKQKRSLAMPGPATENPAYLH